MSLSSPQWCSNKSRPPSYLWKVSCPELQVDVTCCSQFLLAKWSPTEPVPSHRAERSVKNLLGKSQCKMGQQLLGHPTVVLHIWTAIRPWPFYCLLAIVAVESVWYGADPLMWASVSLPAAPSPFSFTGSAGNFPHIGTLWAPRWQVELTTFVCSAADVATLACLVAWPPSQFMACPWENELRHQAERWCPSRWNSSVWLEPGCLHKDCRTSADVLAPDLIQLSCFCHFWYRGSLQPTNFVQDNQWASQLFSTLILHTCIVEDGREMRLTNNPSWISMQIFGRFGRFSSESSESSEDDA